MATLIGHNSVRQKSMGGSFARVPTAVEMEKMRALVEQAMQEGAVGLSTGLIYLPGSFSKTDEIIELATVAAAHGGSYASHLRAETVKISTPTPPRVRRSGSSPAREPARISWPGSPIRRRRRKSSRRCSARASGRGAATTLTR